MRHPRVRRPSVVPRCELLEDRLVPAGDIHSIQHVVIFMQENRSFDSYFGTYPGADGIPMQNGVPTVSVYDPVTGTYQMPYHDTSDVNVGGPHLYDSAVSDINGGKMDGFIQTVRADPDYNGQPLDVMGYHDYHEIPNYWAYANNFVLQDHMFASSLGWTGPSHLYLVSEWSATGSNPYDPSTFQSDLSLGMGFNTSTYSQPLFGWTDLTYLLNKANVSWAYYSAPDSENLDDPDEGVSLSQFQVLNHFVTVQQDGQMGNLKDNNQFFTDVAAGALPAVTWVMPSYANSEHPLSSVSDGQAWITRCVNALMQSPDWNSTAIFITYDEWGGFYDHVAPPAVDANGYGLRIPGLVISPYAKQGYIDHQQLSFDAYVKFIEDDFLGGQRLDPSTDGRPDPRPDVREDTPGLGDLVNDFDFTQAPRASLLLPERPISPNATAGGPYVMKAGQSLHLDASTSFDPQGYPLTYSWDVNGDGVYGDATGVTPTLTWAQLVALGVTPRAQPYLLTVHEDDGHGHVTNSEETTLLVQPAPPAVLVTGAGPGGLPQVSGFDPATGKLQFSFLAYDSRFTGGVRVAAADVNADGVPDIVTAPGPGGGPDVRVFDGQYGHVMIREFMAYSSAFLGGVYVAAGDVNGDGYADIITGADAGGGPHVRVLSGKDGTLLRNFYAYDSRFTGGVRVAAGDVTGDGKADVITAPGATGGPDVRVWNGATGAKVREFMAFDSRFLGGVYVGSGDVNGDGHADILAGAGAGGGPEVKVYSGADNAVLRKFYAYDSRFGGGVSVAAIDLNGDGFADLLTGAGPGGGPNVTVFDHNTLTRLDNFYAYAATFNGGVFVGGQ